MIEINLLPEELKKRRRAAPKKEMSAIKMERIPVTKIAVIAIVAVIAIHVVVFGFGIFAGANFNKLERDYKELMPEKRAAEQLKNQVDKMSRKVAAIDELMVKRFSWAKKLNDLSDSITPGIWLTDLSYDERFVERPKIVPVDTSKGKPAGEGAAGMEKVMERYLIISGAASSVTEEGTALIGRFIKSLKENPLFYSDFSDIELGNIRRERVDNQEVMSFKITCFFKIR